MKKSLRIICMVSALALAAGACSRTESRVQAVAETFLHAYYTGDYAAAAASCTPAYGTLLTRSAEGGDAVSEETRAKIKEALSKTSFTIVSVEVDEAAASALVRYELTVPGLERPVPKSLKLQLEGRTALVDGIQ